MTRAYIWPDDQKARVWRERFPITGEMTWAAGKPGGYYLVGRGFHFDTWQAAINYATSDAP